MSSGFNSRGYAILYGSIKVFSPHQYVEMYLIYGQNQVVKRKKVAISYHSKYNLEI
jgi:hypothetical protein